MGGSTTMPAETTIDVVLVEDNRNTREGLRLLIDGTPSYRCLGAYGSVEQALASALDE